mgnify:CR=1 FL=1
MSGFLGFLRHVSDRTQLDPCTAHEMSLSLLDIFSNTSGDKYEESRKSNKHKPNLEK